MKIAIYPTSATSTNKYIERMVDAIKIAYPDAIISSFPRIKHIFSLSDYSYVWLNWFENLPENGKFRNALIKIITYFLLKFMRVKVISTFHNRQPHDWKNTPVEKLLFYITFKFANRIIVLSKDSYPILEKRFGKSVLSKTVLVPHPSYECTPKSQNKKSDNFKVLFFGLLRPYKNIELILELAKIHPNIIFTIAGMPVNEAYKSKLIHESSPLPNVRLIPKFLSETEVDQLIDDNSIILLPYNIKSSLNSGVVIHAICKGINVIVPSIGTVNQLKNKDAVYSYGYESYVDHRTKLSDMLRIASDEYFDNYEIFVNRIIRLRNEVEVSQSPHFLSQKLKMVFSMNNKKV